MKLRCLLDSLAYSKNRPMSKLELIAKFKIHPGKVEDFKAWSEQCKESVRTKDTGTLRYDWYMNEDESECVVLETYSSSEAVLEHSANLGELMGAGLALGDLTGEVFGEASQELKDALAGLEISYYTPA